MNYFFLVNYIVTQGNKNDLFYLSSSKIYCMVLHEKLTVYVRKTLELVGDQHDNQRSISSAKGYWESSSKINLELDF